jgi:hypothetical protein
MNRRRFGIPMRTISPTYIIGQTGTGKINRPQATAKGLRNSFDDAAFQAKVPPHLVQRWLRHASSARL